MRNGYKLTFNNGECEIVDKKLGEQVAVAKLSSNNLFPLNMKTHVAWKSATPEDTHLWHLRFGHLNFKGLQLLQQKNMVVGLPEIKNNEHVCEGCIYGKMHRLPFPKTVWRANAPLDLVHSEQEHLHWEIKGTFYFLLMTLRG